MAIILEGPDAAGKSTLANLLSQMGMKIRSSGGAPKTPEAVKEYCRWQTDACRNLDNVLDRVTPISHPIYNPTYRGNEMLAAFREEMMSHQNTILVYCRPPVEALMRPEKHQWKDYDTEEDKQKILNNQMVYIDLYDEMMAEMPHLCYDYTIHETDEMVELVAMLGASRVNSDCLKQLRLLQRVMHGCRHPSVTR